MRILGEQALNQPPERPRSFSVDNPDVENAPPAAFFQVIGDEILDFFRPERMKIQHAVDRNLNRLIFFRHPPILPGHYIHFHIF